MKTWKRVTSLLLCLFLAVSALGGCAKLDALLSSKGNSGNSQTGTADSLLSKKNGPYTIGLLQYAEDPSLDTVREAFMNRLEEWDFDEEKVNIEYENAGSSEGKAKEICSAFVKKADMIVAISAPAAQLAAEAAKGTDVVVVFAAEKDAVVSQKNVTGVWSSVDPADAVKMAVQANEKLKTIGILYDPDEPLSREQAEAVKAYCQGKEILFVESPVSQKLSVDQMTKQATELCTQADAILTPQDSTVVQYADKVAGALLAGGTPWYVLTDAMVEAGAAAGKSVDYLALGAEAADMAVELMAGRPVAEVAVREHTDLNFCVNQHTLASLDLSFPQEAMDTAFFYAGKEKK